MPEYLFPVLIVVQVLSALAIILLVLLQQGKGADMGSSFGGGSAGSLFGSAGSANFFSRLTKWVAVLFFVSTLGLAYVGSQAYVRQSTPTEGGSVMDGFSAVPSAPAAPGVENTTVPSGSVPVAPSVTPSAPAAPSSVPAAPSATPVAPDPAAEATPVAPAATEVTPAAPVADSSTPAAESTGAATPQGSTN
ncbi:MAG: preprotein translocase subunit SecG [Pelistega sp.]|nr:preprotein translocase subunit SecG [Pelistega sp.]